MGPATTEADVDTVLAALDDALGIVAPAVVG